MAEPTLAGIQASAQAMLSRLASEGLTTSSGQQTHTYNPTTNQFTPTFSPPITAPDYSNKNYQVPNYQAPDLSSTLNTLDLLMTPEEAEDVRARFGKVTQPLIDTIGDQTALMLAEGKRAANELAARNRALMARSGLLGGQFDIRSQADIDKYNMQQEQKIRTEQDQKINELNKWATEASENIIQANKELSLKAASLKADIKMKEAMQGLEASQIASQIKSAESDSYIKLQTLEKQNELQAWDIIKEMGASGISIEKIPYTTRQKLLSITGLEKDGLEYLLNEYKSDKDKIDFKTTTAGNKIIMSGYDPVTGKIKVLEHTLPEVKEKYKDNYKIGTKEIKTKDGQEFTMIQRTWTDSYGVNHDDLTTYEEYIEWQAKINKESLLPKDVTLIDPKTGQPLSDDDIYEMYSAQD